MGDIQWETEVEMTGVTDLYKVILTLAYDGNDELGVESGERTYAMSHVTANLVETWRLQALIVKGCGKIEKNLLRTWRRNEIGFEK